MFDVPFTLALDSAGEVLVANTFGMGGTCNYGCGGVIKVDPASGKVLRWWPTGERTWGIGLSPDETRLYAASGLSGTLTIIDLVAGKVVKTVKLGGKPWGAIAAPK